MHRLPTFQLDGEASKWWMSLYTEEDQDVVTWEEFVIVFDHQYIPGRVRQTKELEFINFS